MDEEKIKASKMIYIEGYLWAGEGTRAACLRAAELGKKNGIPVTFTFSDSFLVAPFRSDFFGFVKDYCSAVFLNAPEARSFSEMDRLEDAALYVGQIADTAFITNGEHGALVVRNNEIKEVPGFHVRAIDTNGAGDAFAGGTLFGLTHGYSETESARWGNFLASEIVQIAGARLNKDYSSQVKTILGR